MMSRNSLRSSEFYTKLVRSSSHPRTILVPRLPDFVPHYPTVKQLVFLRLENKEVLYGGAAGGGKSEALLMAALQYIDQSCYAALLLRRTYSDLSLPGALIDRAHTLLADSPGCWNNVEKTWTFPSGATLTFGYLDHPNHKYRYQSSEFQFIGFDELTQFGEAEYTYLFSRLRRLKSSDIPLRIRSASNPGGIGHDWVRRRFLAENQSQDRIFVPATLEDNPYLDAEQYRSSLSNLDPTTREQLLLGNWDVHDDGLLAYDLIVSCQAECLWECGTSECGTRNADCGMEEKDASCETRNSSIPHSAIRNPHWKNPRAELYLGVDIGRTRDLSVIWTWEKIGDICWCREIHCMKETSFGEQKDEIRRRLTRNVVKCAIDKGGIGYQLVEELEREYPRVVEGVQLTSGVQGRLAQRLAVGFGELKIRIPDDPILRDDLRQVRKTRVVGGIDRLQTERSSIGHADRFWAAALGYDAAMSFDPSEHFSYGPASLPRAFRPNVRKPSR